MTARVRFSFRRVLPLVLALALLAPPAAGEDEKKPEIPQASFNERLSAFKKALKSRDPKARSRAFDYWRGCPDPRAVSEITKGIKKVEGDESKVYKAMGVTEAGYEKAFSDLEAAKRTMDMGGNNAKAIERYNKTARKVSKALDGAVMKLKNLQNDLTRNRAMLQQAVLVVGDMLKELDGDPLADAMALLAQEWLQAKGDHWPVRWVAAISEVNHPLVTESLRTVVTNAEMADSLRVTAMDALAARADGWVLGKAFEWLKLPLEKSPLVRGGIAALRTMHDKRAIVPLSKFLDRQDLKLERNHAHLALVSLTGVDHGPYGGQWTKWWEDNHKTFVMPKGPKETGDVAPPKKGTTFYGIQTFSDRILFIVDISGSMDKVQKGVGGGKTKMEICKQELIGSVFNLNTTDTFNVIFFNHQVIPWQNRKVQATEGKKKLLKTWVTDQEPLGGTNIYDALELGFKIAHRVTGPPNLDTIFFLTDGNPTAGKIRDAKTILETVKGWNETAKMTIHCIGIGKQHDADFLKALARIGDGKYVRR